MRGKPPVRERNATVPRHRRKSNRNGDANFGGSAPFLSLRGSLFALLFFFPAHTFGHRAIQNRRPPLSGHRKTQSKNRNACSRRRADSLLLTSSRHIFLPFFRESLTTFPFLTAPEYECWEKKKRKKRQVGDSTCSEEHLQFLLFYEETSRLEDAQSTIMSTIESAQKCLHVAESKKEKGDTTP